MALFNPIDIQNKQRPLVELLQRANPKAALFNTIGQLPQAIQQNQLTRMQAQQGQLQLVAAQREQMPVEKAAPGLYTALKSKNIDLSGATFREAKEVLPLLGTLSKEETADHGFIWNPQTKNLEPITGAGGKITTTQAGAINRFNQPTTEPVVTEEDALKAGKVQKGTRIISSKKNKAQGDFNKEALDAVNNIEFTLSQLPSGIKGGAESIASKTGLIFPGIKAYNDTLPATAVKIYRGYTKDIRLSDADAAARALPLLPKINESPDTQNQKISRLRRLISGEAGPDEQIFTLLQVAPVDLANKIKVAQSKGIPSQDILDSYNQSIAERNKK